MISLISRKQTKIKVAGMERLFDACEFVYLKVSFGQDWILDADEMISAEIKVFTFL